MWFSNSSGGQSGSSSSATTSNNNHHLLPNRGPTPIGLGSSSEISQSTTTPADNPNTSTTQTSNSSNTTFGSSGSCISPTQATNTTHQHQQQQLPPPPPPISSSGIGSNNSPAVTPTIVHSPNNVQQQLQQQQPSFHQSPASNNDRPEKISFHLKTSIFTRRVTIDSDKMALGLIKQLAIAFLNELYFQTQYPANTYVGDYIRKHFSNTDNLNILYERLVLRKYNCDQESFVPFNSVSDIEPESYISIEVSEKQPTHLLSSNANHSSAASGSCLLPSSHHHHGGGNQSVNLSSSSSSCSQVKISHEFKPESFLFPTHCASCSTLIKGVFRQGYQCSFCKKNFCPKCKTKAESSGDGCLAPATPTSLTTTQQNATTSHSSVLISSNNSDITCNMSGEVNNNNSTAPTSNTAINNLASPTTIASSTNNKLDVVQVNMTKRKSASNLLHFNIANPFKSHHVQQPSNQQLQQSGQPASKSEDSKSSSKMRGSAGALDPVLQQLGKQLREQQQHHGSGNSGEQVVNCAGSSAGGASSSTTTAANNNNNSLMVAQATHISSSHQNLFVTTTGEKDLNATTSGEIYGVDNNLSANNITGCSSSLNQSPIGMPSMNNRVTQLSNSARTSTQDLRTTSQTKPDHTFISMDWIQINGEPLCGVCNKVLKNTTTNQQQQQAAAPFMCKSCQLQVHAQCQNLVLADCMSRIAESSRAAAASSVAGKQEESAPPTTAKAATTTPDDKTGVKSSNSNVSRDNIRLHRLAPSVKHIKRPDSTKPIIEGWLKHTTLSDEQARKHYWRLDETDITLYENDTSKRYFKAIALNKITRVMSAHSLPKRVKEDVLTSSAKETTISGSGEPHIKGTAKSANTSPAKSPEILAQMNAMFAFELATGSMYLVQANSEIEASKWKESLAAITTNQQQQQQATKAVNDSKKAAELEGATITGDKLAVADQSLGNNKIDRPTVNEQQKAVGFEKHQQPTATVTAAQPKTQPPAKVLLEKQVQQPPRQPPVQRQQHHGYPPTGYRRGQHKTYTDPNRSRLYNRPRITIKLDPMSIPDHYIEGKYLIERDRVRGVGFQELGSGQFGKVYAAISELKAEDSVKGFWSGVPVAIKEISKARFDLRQQEKLKNEANILSRLDHPGVIILERVHDLSDKIYIVMEQLEDDMLEMIVSTEEKRLNERITKFLTYQILEALKYLHAQNIAHCDLKPENVLLVERRSQFPQIKLCDFGFAKIIEENSFRSSLVGTPAYLAPEVVKGERYNRSVDLWSVGVIVYVSLSGEFPFNEGENIHDQISRANFMYPDQPWAKISNQAKSFINSLLRVNCEKRLTANRAQMDDWIQDYQLWCDLSELEVRVGKRWVTDDADFGRWSKYAKEHHLQIPRSAIQLHEDLIAD